MYLNTGEEIDVTFKLNKRSFAYYDVSVKNWNVEEGIYEILIGSSSRDIKLKEEVEVKGNKGTTLNNVPKWYINPIGYPDKEAFQRSFMELGLKNIRVLKKENMICIVR